MTRLATGPTINQSLVLSYWHSVDCSLKKTLTSKEIDFDKLPRTLSLSEVERYKKDLAFHKQWIIEEIQMYQI